LEHEEKMRQYYEAQFQQWLDECAQSLEELTECR